MSLKLVNEGAPRALRTAPPECSCGCNCGLCQGCSCAGPEDLGASRTMGLILMSTKDGGIYGGGGGSMQDVYYG